MSLLDPMKSRLTRDLEPILSLPDPRTKLSAYHDMPYAIFRYDPEEEFELRREVGLLETRLTMKAKRVIRISLAECLDQAMRAQQPLKDWFKAEREMGTQTVVETVHAALSEYTPLVTSSPSGCRLTRTPRTTSFSSPEQAPSSPYTGPSRCLSS